MINFLGREEDGQVKKDKRKISLCVDLSNSI